MYVPRQGKGEHAVLTMASVPPKNPPNSRDSEEEVNYGKANSDVRSRDCVRGRFVVCGAAGQPEQEEFEPEQFNPEQRESERIGPEQFEPERLEPKECKPEQREPE